MKVIAALRRNKAYRQAVFLVLAGVAIWMSALAADLFDTVDRFIHEHEDWEIDEVFFAVMLTGLGGLIFSGWRLRDLSEEIERRDRAERDVVWIARHDPLTRLPNRRGLEERLRELAAEPHASRLLVAYAIDLDGFKKLNDLFGHQAGDEALVAVADRLRHLFPQEAIFRVGGDEFLVLQHVARTPCVMHLAEEIVASLSEPYLLGGVTADMSASVGVATAPEDADDAASLIKLADLAMYAAKRLRTSRVARYDAAMGEAQTRRNRLERDLRQALKDGAVEPHFQPLVDLRTREIVGFEALARWCTPDGRTVAPDEFIPLAEDTGLITELSEQMLRKACIAASDWPHHVSLAFNVSPAQMTDKLLGLRILRILGETGLTPDRLEIEVTESAIIQHVEMAELVIADLVGAGIRIVIDDFGTGFSSLAQLSRFPFEKIKIDRSFVGRFEVEEKQEMIVQAIVGLGRRLGLTTTAEGIESESQAVSLRAIGCDQGQGFHFSPAVPAAATSSLLREDRRRRA
ncbi:putative bifunctional diguanylate cyclase/phosphodiesterase [Aquibium microcysteis]|uniref:putative bifunctional diguanylate cyclase/phosphodiesterase n=1 Tax=Aquibium microcysteis TaxID=675281 RepID=UPI00165D2BCB|nr:EAL domain-containing protein [Aquibium microcysteis]